jgi:hypothetical protein
MLNESKKDNSNFSKFKEVLIVCVIGFLIIGIIYQFGKNSVSEVYSCVLQTPIDILGKVIAKRNYKGKGIDVEYLIDKKKYKYKTGIDNKTYNLYQIGDTISVVVCRNDPSKALLKMELSNELIERFVENRGK